MSETNISKRMEVQGTLGLDNKLDRQSRLPVILRQGRDAKGDADPGLAERMQTGCLLVAPVFGAMQEVLSTRSRSF